MSVTNVVLGAGVVGTGAAYHLASRGERVLLLEQHRLFHSQGSSHGPSRIIRHSYADPDCARLMPAAFDAWRRLEADAGEALYIRTGGYSLCDPALDYVARVSANLDAIDVPHRRLDARELHRTWPDWKTAGEVDAVFEPDAGVLLAERCLRAHLSQAQRLGGDRFTLEVGARVERIDLEGSRPVVVLGDRRISCDRLLIAAGACTTQLLPDLKIPLVVTRQQVFHFEAADPVRYTPGRFPIVIQMTSPDGEGYYGLPDVLGAGVKFARHHGTEPVDLATLDRTPDAQGEALVREFLLDHLPDLASAPLRKAEVCLYTVAPGEQFHMGPLVGRPDVIVASACSGHGFKFGNLVGRTLAEYAIDGQPTIDVASWRTAS